MPTRRFGGQRTGKVRSNVDFPTPPCLTPDGNIRSTPEIFSGPAGSDFAARFKSGGGGLFRKWRVSTAETEQRPLSALTAASASSRSLA